MNSVNSLKVFILMIFLITSCNKDSGEGCNDQTALNFIPTSQSSINCEYSGCTDEYALNFNSQATINDSSCIFNLTNFIIENIWQIESVTTELDNIEIDVFNLFNDLIPICTHDNLFNFDFNGIINMNDNINICGEDELSIIPLSGNWGISGSTLTIINGKETYDLQIINITENTIEIIFPFNFSDTITLYGKLTLISV